MVSHAVPLVAAARKYAATVLTVAKLRKGRCITMHQLHTGRRLSEAGMVSPVPLDRTAAPVDARARPVLRHTQ